MKGEYKISDILIGTLVTNQLMGGQIGYAKIEVGPLFFCKQELESDCVQRYMELFNEQIKRVYKISDDIEAQTFNKTYVKEIDNIANYLTKEELSSKKVSSMRLVEIYKNYTKIKKVSKISNIISLTNAKEEKDKQLVKMEPIKKEKQA